MNKMRNVDISFACMGGLFKAGEMMSGTLGFTLIERMAIKEITLTIHGRAEVSFQAGKYTYSKKEKYMKETKSLFPSSGEADDHPALNPGNYTFSFEHLLNSTIPSSFEGKYGHVRYSVEVKIDRGIWKPAITKSRKFIIKNDLDLNSLSSVQEPVRYDSSAVDGCCCWKQGKLDVTVRLPRKGYVPGEAIYLDADVNNATTSRGHVSVELIQFTTYYTRSGSKRWRQTLYTRPRVTLGVGESLELSGEPIHVPQLPPSGLPWCKLVDIVYTLRVKVKVRGLECKIPINLTIGTIPLRSVFGTPMLTPPPYQQEPEPFSSLWENPPSPPTSLPSPWEVTRSPWELPPSPPGYTALPSPTGPLPPRPPPYEETQPRRTMENLDL